MRFCFYAFGRVLTLQRKLVTQILFIRLRYTTARGEITAPLKNNGDLRKNNKYSTITNIALTTAAVVIRR